MTHLRDYQLAGRREIYAAWRAGAKGVLYVGVTGSGKTMLGTSIVRDACAKGLHVTWVAHREELLKQARDTLRDVYDVDASILGPGYRHEPDAPVTVVSVQTLLARGPELPSKLTVLDECFPAGTMVDGRPIETIRPGDTVTCVDHEFGVPALRRVLRTSKKLFFGRTITLRADHRGVTCTPEHPIYVEGKGYVEAQEVEAGDVLCVWEEIRDSEAFDVLEGVSLRHSLVCDGDDEPKVRQRSHDREQSNAQAGSESASQQHPAQDWALPKGPRGERGRGNATREEGSEGSRAGTSRSGSDENSTSGWVPDALQAGRGVPGLAVSNRGGWEFPHGASATGAGRKKRCVLARARVDSVARDEPRGGGGLEVYNLEVEGCHTYFADEILVHNCHHYAASEWKKAIDVPGRALGLTATPERSDGRPLDCFDTLVAGPKYSELIAAGHIVPCKVFRPDEALARGIAQDPVRAYEAHGEGKQGFVFAPTVGVAHEWAQAFREAGHPADVIEADTTPDERAALLKQFRDRRLRLLVNVYVLTEGVDVPAAEVCLLGRGCGHVSPYLQMVGRVLRPAADKEYGILIDLAGASYQHGLPTQDREYSLTDGIRNAPAVPGEPSLRVCISCGLTLQSGKPCPCGFRPEPQLVRPTIYDMALREVCPDDVQHEGIEKKMRELKLERLLAEWRATRGKPIGFVVGEYRKVFGEAPDLSALPLAEKRREYDAWKRQAQERGHNAGWIEHRYRAAFGSFPPRDWRAGVARTG